MKRLILIRHGHATPATDERADFERQLSPAGEREVESVAERLASSGCRPEAVIASSAPRALATANRLARHLEGVAVVADGGLYLAGPEMLLAAVAALAEPAQQTVALVAHNPGLTLLVRELAAVALGDLPTAGIAGIRFESDRWDALRAGELCYFDTPLNPPSRREW